MSKGQKAAHTRAENEMKRHQSLIEGPNNDKLRFVKLSEIKPLPGTYVKDTPRADYSDLIDSIKKSGLEQPVILRQGENGGYQLVHGFHRCEALKQAGMLEIRADVYSMKLSEASEYRKNRDKNPPIPGTLILPHPPAPPEKEAAEPAPEKEQEPELPKNLHIPLAPEGKEETVTTAKVSDLYAFEGHPFYVNEDKDMWDLVESIKQFGVLEPVTVIPREKGGYEMVSGHRRKRACELAGITDMTDCTMPPQTAKTAVMISMALPTATLARTKRIKCRRANSGRWRSRKLAALWKTLIAKNRTKRP